MKRCISTFTIPISIRPGTMVTKAAGLPLTKSHISFTMWSRDKKMYISTSIRPMSIKLGTVITEGEGHPLTKSYDFRLRGYLMSRDEIETFHFHFQKAYKNET